MCGLSENDLFVALLGRHTVHETDEKAFLLLIISVALQSNITEPSIHCNE